MKLYLGGDLVVRCFTTDKTVGFKSELFHVLDKSSADMYKEGKVIRVVSTDIKRQWKLQYLSGSNKWRDVIPGRFYYEVTNNTIGTYLVSITYGDILDSGCCKLLADNKIIRTISDLPKARHYAGILVEDNVEYIPDWLISIDHTTIIKEENGNNGYDTFFIDKYSTKYKASNGNYLVYDVDKPEDIYEVEIIPENIVAEITLSGNSKDGSRCTVVKFGLPIAAAHEKSSNRVVLYIDDFAEIGYYFDESFVNNVSLEETASIKLPSELLPLFEEGLLRLRFPDNNPAFVLSWKDIIRVRIEYSYDKSKWYSLQSNDVVTVLKHKGEISLLVKSYEGYYDDGWGILFRDKGPIDEDFDVLSYLKSKYPECNLLNTYDDSVSIPTDSTSLNELSTHSEYHGFEVTKDNAVPYSIMNILSAYGSLEIHADGVYFFTSSNALCKSKVGTYLIYNVKNPSIVYMIEQLPKRAYCTPVCSALTGYEGVIISFTIEDKV